MAAMTSVANDLFPQRRLIIFNAQRIIHSSISTQLLAARTPHNMAILRSKQADLHIPENLSCTEFVFQNFDKYGDRTAIIEAVSGRSISYNQIKDQTRRFSSALVKRGFKKGDVLAIYIPDFIEYPIIFHGVACLGGVATTLNPVHDSIEDLVRRLTITRAKYLVTIPSLAVQAFSSGALKEIRSVIVIGEAQGCESISTLLSDDGSAFPKSVQINPKEDVVALLSSSGTTGIPKVVMITHYNLIAEICLVFMKDGPLLEDMGRVLSVKSFCHIYGFAVTLGGRLHVGTKLVVLEHGFEPHAFLQAIQDYQVVKAPLYPPIVLFLVKHPLVEKYDLSSLKFLFSGAASLARDLEIGVANRLPHVKVLRQGYGMTELCCLSHFTVPDFKIKPGSVGVLLPNLECKVIDPDSGMMLGPNKNGEVCIRGPTVMKGYLDNPEATAKTIDSDGWLHTGDIGHYDEDEYFFIVDRLKELIKYKGYQVSPAELEALLISHPNIQDAAVIGIPDLEVGEVPKAFVVRRGGMTSEEIMEFVTRNAPPQNNLSGGVEFVDEIPRSCSGKIVHRLLKEKENKKSL